MMHLSRSVRPRIQQQGSSLIEMVVALFVLASGMLGVIAMQLKSMQFNQSAYYYSQATFLAYDILERMRANDSVGATYVIAFDEDAPEVELDCEDVANVCTPAQLRDYNLSNWRSRVEGALASGRSSIANDGEFVTITVQFDDSRSNGELDGGEQELAEYVLVSEI